MRQVWRPQGRRFPQRDAHWNVSEHPTVRFVHPQAQDLETGSSHGGQSPGWHTAKQECPQGRVFPQVSRQEGAILSQGSAAAASGSSTTFPQGQVLTPPPGQDEHGSSGVWQTLEQEWRPQGRGDPQGTSHRQGRSLQGTRVEELPQAHVVETDCVQGGQGPSWQGSGQGWPHRRSEREQGRPHE